MALGKWGRGPTRRLRAGSYRLQVEVLEDRRLLADFLVTTTADSGPGLLRQAILDANANQGADTIAFDIG